MRTFVFLLIFYTMIDFLVCEVIEIKGPIETRHPNSSAILDKAILRSDPTDGVKYAPIFKDPLNFTFVPWPMTRVSRDENQSLDFKDSEGSPNFFSVPITRTPKSVYTSANLPSRAPEERRMISSGQLTYPNWDEMSTKPDSNVASVNKKCDKEDDNASVDAEINGSSLVTTKNLRRREKRRKNEGINRQLPGYDENIHTPDEYYASPEKYFSASNYEPEIADTYEQKYVSESGRYGFEDYNSYSTENYKDNRYHEYIPDFYSGSPDRWPPRYSRPNLAYNSRFSVGSSHENPARGGPSPSLIAIFSAIGSNLLQLFKIGLGSGLSIAIPIIAIKLFLIPLKILKFIKIVKIFLKLIFVIPFILRVFAPSIYSAIGNHDIGFSNKMVAMPTPESRTAIDRTTENSTWWNILATNLTSALPDAVSEQKCPSRVACELGSYLASRNNIPEKLMKFFADDNVEESKDFNEERNKKEEVTRAFIRALTQRWTYDRCDVFVCGISL